MSSKRVFTFHYTVKNDSGQGLDSSRNREPMKFLEGAQEIIPGLELQLIKMVAGDKKTISLTAPEAYGNRDEKKVVLVPRTNLPEGELQVGDLFQTDVEGETTVMQVAEVGPEFVKMDGNHPLAGMALTFDVEMLEIRQATKEEIEHGHAHDAHSHSH